MTDGRPAFHEFARADAMFSALAGEIAHRLDAAIAARGVASLAVCGGTTPGPLFDALARRVLPWPKVLVTLSDERWVDPASERSNERLVRTRLLVANARETRFVPLKTPAAHARDAEKNVDAAVAVIPKPFDVVLLGMGNDGHTASLIPGANGLARALDPANPLAVQAVDPPQQTGLGERMTLTLPALLNARWIALLIRGSEKRRTYETALAGQDVAAMPVRGVLQQSAVPVDVYWSA